jgi:hypothetical protein
MTADGVYEFQKDGFYEVQHKELKRDVRKLKHLEFLLEDVRVQRLHKTYHIPFEHFFFNVDQLEFPTAENEKELLIRAENLFKTNAYYLSKCQTFHLQ